MIGIGHTCIQAKPVNLGEASRETSFAAGRGVVGFVQGPKVASFSLITRSSGLVVVAAEETSRTIVAIRKISIVAVLAWRAHNTI